MELERYDFYTTFKIEELSDLRSRMRFLNASRYPIADDSKSSVG